MSLSTHTHVHTPQTYFCAFQWMSGGDFGYLQKKMSGGRCSRLHQRWRNSHNKCSPYQCVCVCVWERERERERESECVVSVSWVWVFLSLKGDSLHPSYPRLFYLRSFSFTEDSLSYFWEEGKRKKILHIPRQKWLQKVNPNSTVLVRNNLRVRDILEWEQGC
jgi:hypothetical protein